MMPSEVQSFLGIFGILFLIVGFCNTGDLDPHLYHVVII